MIFVFVYFTYILITAVFGVVPTRLFFKYRYQFNKNTERTKQKVQIYTQFV
jgi:hypothetical protein